MKKEHVNSTRDFFGSRGYSEEVLCLRDAVQGIRLGYY